MLRSLSLARFLTRSSITTCNRFMSSDSQPLTLCTQENGIRRIVLNNPSKRNALSFALMESLKDNILRGVKEESLRVIIISANGPVFCSGHDLQELISKHRRSDHANIFHLCSDIMELVQDVPVPVVCEVGALATAAGCQLVASCDIAVASQHAKFCTPGVNIGLFCSTPAVALGRAVPRKLALDMLFTGKVIDAEDALAHGLVSRLVDHDKLHDEVMSIAEGICEKSRSVIAMGKASFYRQIVKDRNSAYQDASNIMVENLCLHDGQEGIKAFLNKTKPKWDHSLD
uniref:Enoyl-CoA hydratase domain-containing protein 3, mitochondrial n=1 Tax=Phallusia mammillata TaxID=59560 RepID=A0A6F9DC46_9ASCI|nr:enoyl-CoA hydratase domain-containing protein 3, mitochondrial [Phallusia mammillata]